MASNKKLNATLTIGGAVSSSLGTAFSSVKSQLGRLQQDITAMNRQQNLLTRSITEFGRAGKNIDSLRAKYTENIAVIDRLRLAQERLNRATKMVSAGKAVGMATGGAALAAGVVSKPLIGAAISRENIETVIKNSGVSDEDAQHMIDAAKGAKQFGISTTRATETVSELRTALGDAHHAIEALPTSLKALSGLALYDRLHHTNLASGESGYNLAKVAEERGGAVSPEAMRAKMDWAFKGITGSNGKVTVADQLLSQRTGKGAAAAMLDEAFFGDTFLQQAMGADRYGTSSSSLVNAWIGGHQTHGAFDEMMKLGLLDKSKVQFDKIGKVKKVQSDSLIDYRLFLKDPQAWVDKYLAPKIGAKGDGTDDEATLMQFASSIASNPRAADLIMQRLRFRKNIWKDRNNVINANGIDKSDEMNRKSTQGKIDDARARLDDAEERMGNVLLPVFASAMEKAASALESINSIADKSPGLFKAATWGLVGVTAALGGATGVGIVAPLAARGLVTLQAGITGVTTAAGALSTSLIGKAGLAGALAMVGLEVAKLLGLPDVNKEQGQKDLKNGDWLAASMHLPAGDFIGAVWDRFTKSGKDAPTSYKSIPTVTDNSTTTIQVTQQPGQDQKALVDEMIRQLENKRGVRQRSMMFDGATAQ